MGKEANTKKTRIVIRMGRFDYPHIDKPVANQFGDELKYGTTFLIQKQKFSTLSKIAAAIEEAKQEGSKLYGEHAEFVSPLKDGDKGKSDREHYRSHFYLNASSKFKPQVINGQLQRISGKEIYAGCYGSISVTFYPYQFEEKYGIGCSLNNAQFLQHGEPIVNGINAEDEFALEAEEDEDIF